MSHLVRRAAAAALLALGSTAVFVPALNAQTEEEEAVLATVQRFFDSLAARDTAMARRALLPEGYSVSTSMSVSGPRISGFTHAAYLEGLPNGTDEWGERMWDPEVRVRGTIATVWTPYEFLVNGERSHCGIDAFNLVKTGVGWRIASVVYTVEQQCDGAGE